MYSLLSFFSFSFAVTWGFVFFRYFFFLSPNTFSLVASLWVLFLRCFASLLFVFFLVSVSALQLCRLQHAVAMAMVVVMAKLESAGRRADDAIVARPINVGMLTSRLFVVMVN